MFTKRRVIKKNRKSNVYKKIIVLLFGFAIILLTLKIFSLNFSLGRQSYLSPLASNRNSVSGDLEKNLEKSGINYSNIVVKGNSEYIYLKDGGEVILSSKKDIKAQVSSLQFILSRLTIEGKKLKVLDLRYNRPIISF